MWHVCYKKGGVASGKRIVLFRVRFSFFLGIVLMKLYIKPGSILACILYKYISVKGIVRLLLLERLSHHFILLRNI